MGPECDLTPGGWPIIIRGVECIVAVLVINGLGPKIQNNGRDEMTDARQFGLVEAANPDHELIVDAMKVVLGRSEYLSLWYLIAFHDKTPLTPLPGSLCKST